MLILKTDKATASVYSPELEFRYTFTFLISMMREIFISDKWDVLSNVKKAERQHKTCVLTGCFARAPTWTVNSECKLVTAMYFIVLKRSQCHVHPFVDRVKPVSILLAASGDIPIFGKWCEIREKEKWILYVHWKESRFDHQVTHRNSFAGSKSRKHWHLQGIGGMDEGAEVKAGWD